MELARRPRGRRRRRRGARSRSARHPATNENEPSPSLKRTRSGASCASLIPTDRRDRLVEALRAPRRRACGARGDRSHRAADACSDGRPRRCCRRDRARTLRSSVSLYWGRGPGSPSLGSRRRSAAPTRRRPRRGRATPKPTCRLPCRRPCLAEVRTMPKSPHPLTVRLLVGRHAERLAVEGAARGQVGDADLRRDRTRVDSAVR